MDESATGSVNLFSTSATMKAAVQGGFRLRRGSDRQD
jgi:hypothetical protein